MAHRPDCQACNVRPSRPGDAFCSDICAADFAKRCERNIPVETTRGETTRHPRGGDGLIDNLQNSA